MKISIILFFSFCFAQLAVAQQANTSNDNLQTAQFKVLGNCGMCKKTIEKAALGAQASTAVWDVKTDMISVAFDGKKTSKEALQKPSL